MGAGASRIQPNPPTPPMHKRLEMVPVKKLMYEMEPKKMLFLGAMEGSESMVVKAMTLGMTPNEVDTITNMTPLHFAARYGHDHIIEALIKMGAQTNCKQKYGWRPVHEAAMNGRLECLDLLLRCGSHVNAKTGVTVRAMTPLHYAVKYGHLGCAKFLVAHGGKVNKTNEIYETPLHMAAMRNEPECLEFLLLNDANIKARTLRDMDAAYMAAVVGSVPCLRVLLRHGIDLNTKYGAGYTLMHCAVINGREGFLEMLIARGAELERKTYEKELTPLHLGARQGQSSPFRLLLEANSMAHLRFETGVNECLKTLEAPLTNGPQFRWQRKQQQRLRGSHAGDRPLSPLPNNYQAPSPSVKSRRKTPLKPKQTPKKTPKKPAENSTLQGDRFIPNRTTTDCEWGHYQMVYGSHDQDDSSDTADETVENPQKSKEKQSDARVEGSKILHFKTGAPASKQGYQNNLRVLYCQSKPSGPKAKSTRHIPQTPDRILDAPDVVDDYYLNILDWGTNNLIALALGGAVYIWNADGGDTRHLLQMEGEDYVSSVSWIKEGSILAVGNCNGQVQLWDVDASKCVRMMGGHGSRISALSWNSFILSSGSRSGAIHNHDVRVANHHVGTLLNHTQEVCGLRWSLDGKLLASGGNDNIVNIWSMATGNSTNENPLFSLNRHQAAIKALSWCPFQTNVLATGGGTADRHIRFWNASTGVCLNSFDTKSQ
ncbi:hypothetical protein QZH41_012044, partial [Actinostola sp. cb2023]